MKKFVSVDEYIEWTEQFENTYEYQAVPCIVDDGWKIAADMLVDCKTWKTAIRRFRKAFSKEGEIFEWIDCIQETCENGCFGETDGWKPANTSDPREIEECAKYGTYSWGIEETADGLWYIFLNISGGYVRRKN